MTNFTLTSRYFTLTVHEQRSPYTAHNVQVCVEVDEWAVAKELANKAFCNKSKVAKEIGGAVKVRFVKEITP